MPNCCIENCDNSTSNTAYFKFPVHNAELMQKWLSQIGKPDWKPDRNSYICAAHFCAWDIVDHPNRKYLVLKENALPTIFPKHMNHISKSEPQKLEVPVVNNCTTLKSGIAMLPPLIQTTPLVLTPTIVEPLATIDSTLLPLSGASKRFRKILPKLNQSPSVMPLIPTGKNNVDSSTLPKSYIIIIPTFDNTKTISAPSTPPKLPPPNKKKPILRLTVNRKYDIDPALVESNTINDYDETKGDSMGGENSEGNKNSLIEEVVVKHETLNKFVVYSLDVATGEISVSYRDNSPVPGRNSKLPGTHMKLRENPRKRKIWEEPTELGNMYKRVKKDCTTLRSRLQILRKKHKKEKDAIEKLKEKLAVMETHQEITSVTTEKQIDKSPTSENNFELMSQIDQDELSNDRRGINDDVLSEVNKQLQSSMNNNQPMSIGDKSQLAKSIEMENQPFIWRLSEDNGGCDFIEIDEATVTIQTSDLKTRDSYANINDAGCVNY